MLLYHDVPSSKGVENALRRARQMLEVSYTPVGSLPISQKLLTEDGGKMYIEDHAPAWFPLKGMIYSSVRRVEKYVGFNVSLETFLTAVSNPNSVVYTQPIRGTGQNVHNYYGIVCSCFASYVLDLPYRTPCARLPRVEGMTEIDPSPLENLRLCDLVLNVKKHVAVITGIERDVAGRVHAVTVSESVMPRCRTTRFTPEEFRGYWLADGYRIYRYAGLDRVSYTPDPFVPLEGDETSGTPRINPVLMPDFGNKANYRLGNEAVTLSVFDPECGTVIIVDPDGEESACPVYNGRAVIVPQKAGFFSARCAAGEESACVRWCVTDFRLEADKAAYTPGESIRLKFFNAAPDSLVAWQFNSVSDDRGRGGGYLTETEAGGELALCAPDAFGRYELYLIARNAFGAYSSNRIPIVVEPD